MSNAIMDFFKEAGAYTLLGAPAAIVRTVMKKDRTWRDFWANGASCAFISPLAGWTATYFFPASADGKWQGIVYVIIGVATLLGKDLIEGFLREGELFRSAPRETMQAWLTFWKNLFMPSRRR